MRGARPQAQKTTKHLQEVSKHSLMTTIELGDTQSFFKPADYQNSQLCSIMVELKGVYCRMRTKFKKVFDAEAQQAQKLSILYHSYLDYDSYRAVKDYYVTAFAIRSLARMMVSQKAKHASKLSSIQQILRKAYIVAEVLISYMKPSSPFAFESPQAQKGFEFGGSLNIELSSQIMKINHLVLCSQLEESVRILSIASTKLIQGFENKLFVARDSIKIDPLRKSVRTKLRVISNIELVASKVTGKGKKERSRSTMPGGH